jgi:hypothetical protein
MQARGALIPPRYRQNDSIVADLAKCSAGEMPFRPGIVFGDGHGRTPVPALRLRRPFPHRRSFLPVAAETRYHSPAMRRAVRAD